MNNTVATPEAESTVRRTSLCKCGKKAEFIKDYWVTESKVLKEQSGDDVHAAPYIIIPKILHLLLLYLRSYNDNIY